MAKAILEFDLNNIDDERMFKRCTKSQDLASALWDIEQYLRSQIKYNEELSYEGCKAVEEVRKRFYEIVNEYSIDLDTITN